MGKFDQFANATAKIAGRPEVFIAVLALIIGWVLCGPLFNWSDSWQLFVNTATTIVTFLMVFLLQATQNRDTVAMQLKLDELIKAIDKADNRLIGVERGAIDERS